MRLGWVRSVSVEVFGDMSKTQIPFGNDKQKSYTEGGQPWGVERFVAGSSGGEIIWAFFCLFFYGGDLAVDEVEAALGFGDLLAEVGGQLGEQVAVFAGGGFGVAAEVGEVA